MAITEIYTKVLSDSCRQKLGARLSGITYPEDNYSEYQKQIGAVRKIVEHEFCDLSCFLNDNINDYQQPAAIKIMNLPVSESVPMPPADGGSLKRIKKNDYISENLLMLIASFFGSPYSMYCEGKGLINNLIPSRRAANELTGLGATSDLRFHIENAALRFMTGCECAPKALFLIGVKQDVAPPYTRLSDARLALDLVTAEDRRILCSPAFKIKLPYRWRKYRPQYETLATDFVPLVQYRPTGIIVNAAFYGDMVIEVASARAREAAANFENALEQVGIDEVVEPGQMLGIDNRRTLHARTPFNATFDGFGRAHRWAQRVFVTDSLANFEDWQETDFAVFAPNFTSCRTLPENAEQCW
jgi:L-asparagine oxygenase